MLWGGSRVESKVRLGRFVFFNHTYELNIAFTWFAVLTIIVNKAKTSSNRNVRGVSSMACLSLLANTHANCTAMIATRSCFVFCFVIDFFVAFCVHLSIQQPCNSLGPIELQQVHSFYFWSFLWFFLVSVFCLIQLACPDERRTQDPRHHRVVASVYRQSQHTG